MLNETIRTLRKNRGLTQEEMAEKLCVSRQAITKWESGLGTPDIVNLEAIAKLFDVTIDELLSSSLPVGKENMSRTEFDILSKSDFDFSVGVANSLDVTFHDEEKAIVEVYSDLEKESFKLAKVKLENGRHIDLSVVDIKTDKRHLSVKKSNELSKMDAKQHLFIRLVLPYDYSDKVELSGDIENLRLHDVIKDKHIEFGGKVREVAIENCKGHIELDNKVDAEIHYDGSLRQLDINQIKCVSCLFLKDGAEVNMVNKGKFCQLLFKGYENKPTSKHGVELNGFKSELTVIK